MPEQAQVAPLPHTEQKEKKLRGKELVFVETYLATWNKSEAARQAGYKGRPDVVGANVFARPHIKATVEKRITEKAMKANEVLARLAEQAQVNPADFFYFEDQPAKDKDGKPLLDKAGHPVTKRVQAGINWGMVEKYGYLIKSVEYDRRGNVVLKFHDVQNALVHIGKHLKLFSDQIDLTFMNAMKAYIGISPDDWDDESEDGDGEE